MKIGEPPLRDAELLDGEHPGTNTIEEALQLQWVIDAIYGSAEQGTSIKLSTATNEVPVAED